MEKRRDALAPVVLHLRPRRSIASKYPCGSAGLHPARTAAASELVSSLAVVRRVQSRENVLIDKEEHRKLREPLAEKMLRQHSIPRSAVQVTNAFSHAKPSKGTIAV